MVATCFVIALLISLRLQVGQSATIPDSLTESQRTQGEILADDFSKTSALINQNLYNGAASLSKPLIKFAVDTAPHLVHLYAILNGVNIPPVLAALGKDIYGRLAVLVGHTAGGAAVLGSSVLGNGMEVGGAGLDALNDILNKGAKVGINLSGNAADHTIAAGILGADVLNTGLFATGDGMMASSAAADVVSQGISQLINAIGAKLVIAIASAEEKAAQLLDNGAKVLEGKVIKFSNKQQENVYNALQSYISVLGRIQNILKQFISTVSESKPN